MFPVTTTPDMASCNKKCFATRKEAKKFLKEANKVKRLAKELTNVYWCEGCNSFHVTSQDKERSREYTRKLNS
jgi:hypothetical protein